MIPFPHSMLGQGVSVTYTATAWLFPGSMGSISIGGPIWNGTGNIGADDGARATSIMTEGAGAGNYLRGSNFNFAGESIPSGATITGVEARISRYSADPDTVADQQVLLYPDYTTGSPSLNRAKAGNWPTTEAIQTYGASNDLWGLAITKAMLEATNFALALQLPAANCVAAVNYFQVRAHYYY